MKTLLSAFASLLAAATLTAEDTVCLNWGAIYNLPAGKVLSFQYCGHNVDLVSAYGEIRIEGSIQGEVLLFSGTPEQLMPTQRFGGNNENISGCPCANMIVCGPAAIHITSTSPASSVTHFHVIATVKDQAGTPAAQQTTVPQCAVVIPEDAAGPVEIKLESSIDMVNWNAANPGTYGASVEKRFFRVRAIANP